MMAPMNQNFQKQDSDKYQKNTGQVPRFPFAPLMGAQGVQNAAQKPFQGEGNAKSGEQEKSIFGRQNIPQNDVANRSLAGSALFSQQGLLRPGTAQQGRMADGTADFEQGNKPKAPIFGTVDTGMLSTNTAIKGQIGTEKEIPMFKQGFQGTQHFGTREQNETKQTQTLIPGQSQSPFKLSLEIPGSQTPSMPGKQGSNAVQPGFNLSQSFGRPQVKPEPVPQNVQQISDPRVVQFGSGQTAQTQQIQQTAQNQTGNIGQQANTVQAAPRIQPATASPGFVPLNKNAPLFQSATRQPVPTYTDAGMQNLPAKTVEDKRAVVPGQQKPRPVGENKETQAREKQIDLECSIRFSNMTVGEIAKILHEKLEEQTKTFNECAKVIVENDDALINMRFAYENNMKMLEEQKERIAKINSYLETMSSTLDELEEKTAEIPIDQTGTDLHDLYRLYDQIEEIFSTTKDNTSLLSLLNCNYHLLSDIEKALEKQN